MNGMERLLPIVSLRGNVFIRIKIFFALILGFSHFVFFLQSVRCVNREAWPKSTYESNERIWHLVGFGKIKIFDFQIVEIVSILICYSCIQLECALYVCHTMYESNHNHLALPPFLPVLQWRSWKHHQNIYIFRSRKRNVNKIQTHEPSMCPFAHTNSAIWIRVICVARR